MKKQLPKNWVNVSLQDVTKNVKGKKPKIQSEIEFEGSIPYMDIKALDYNVIRQFADIESSKLFDEGDVAMVWDGARSGWVSKTNFGAIGSTIVAFKPIVINSNFLFYYLFDKYPFINSNARGVGIPHVDPTVLWALKFPLPPLAEQNRIVEKLDALFMQNEAIKKSISKIPELLKNFRQQVLTQAVTGKLTEEWRRGKELESSLVEILNNRKKYYENNVLENKKNGLKAPKKLDDTNFEMFELSNSFKIPSYWEKANLKNISDLITDGEHATPKRTEDGYLLLSARNVQNGFISLKNVDYVPKEEYDRIIKRCKPEPHDVLISCSGTVGRISLVPENLEFVMVRSAALVKFQSNKGFSKFIEYTLRSDFGQSQINKLQKATAQANLFLAPIGKIVIPIPSIQEIKEIVIKVEVLVAKADVIEQQYKTLKAKIDTLPQAILHKAFKGELSEQLDSDSDASELLKQIQELKKSGVKPKKATTKKVKNYPERDGVLGMVAEK